MGACLALCKLLLANIYFKLFLISGLSPASSSNWKSFSPLACPNFTVAPEAQHVHPHNALNVGRLWWTFEIKHECWCCQLYYIPENTRHVLSDSEYSASGWLLKQQSDLGSGKGKTFWSGTSLQWTLKVRIFIYNNKSLPPKAMLRLKIVLFFKSLTFWKTQAGLHSAKQNDINLSLLSE